MKWKKLIDILPELALNLLDEYFKYQFQKELNIIIKKNTGVTIYEWLTWKIKKTIKKTHNFKKKYTKKFTKNVCDNVRQGNK